MEAEEGRCSVAENLEAEEDAEFWMWTKVLGEAEVHIEMEVASCFSFAEPEVTKTL
jgi:hypothetical protein